MEKLISKTLIFFISFSIFGCNSKNCKVDKYVSNTVKIKIEIIEDFESGKPTGVSKYLDAISFFSKVSGHKSQMKIDGALGYGNDTLRYEEDLSKWKSWYSDNKCSLTKKGIDSIISLIE